MVAIPLVFGLLEEKADLVIVCTNLVVTAMRDMRPCSKWAFIKKILDYILKTHSSFCLMFVITL